MTRPLQVKTRDRMILTLYREFNLRPKEIVLKLRLQNIHQVYNAIRRAKAEFHAEQLCEVCKRNHVKTIEP